LAMGDVVSCGFHERIKSKIGSTNSGQYHGRYLCPVHGADLRRYAVKVET
jgi:hypothetical protein